MIEIGLIVNTQGLRGEMRVRSESDFKADRFRIGAKVYIDQVAYTVESFRSASGFDVLKLEQINHIDQAEALKGKAMYAPLEEASLSEGEYHVSQLIGCEVFDAGVKLGMVTDVRPMPAQPLLVVDNKIQIPFVGAFIQEVNLASRRIDVTLIEGMR
jgi:16S rRNA processing protein RimM